MSADIARLVEQACLRAAFIERQRGDGMKAIPTVSPPLRDHPAPPPQPLPSPDRPPPVIGILSHGYGFFPGGAEPNYEAAVRMGGGIPRPLTQADLAKSDPLDGIDGLVIPGGADVNPQFYHQVPDPAKHVEPASPEFDAFEIEMIRRALGSGMPLLGICRGIQILNVAADGTLLQDIPSDLDRPDQLDVRHRGMSHKILVTPGSRLHEILETDVVVVNSFHHQAVAAVAPGFVAVAFAPDGIVEAIQNSRNAAQIGVQFHPEKLAHADPRFRRFFEFLVRDAVTFHDRHLPLPPDGTAPSGNDPAESFLAGLARLAGRGIGIRTAAGSPLETHADAIRTAGLHAALQTRIAGATVVRLPHNGTREIPLLTLQTPSETVELVCSEADELGRLPESLRRAVETVRKLQGMGTRFFDAGVIRDTEILFPIQAAWLMERGTLVAQPPDRSRWRKLPVRSLGDLDHLAAGNSLSETRRSTW